LLVSVFLRAHRPQDLCRRGCRTNLRDCPVAAETIDRHGCLVAGQAARLSGRPEGRYLDFAGTFASNPASPKNQMAAHQNVERFQGSPVLAQIQANQAIVRQTAQGRPPDQY